MKAQFIGGFRYRVGLLLMVIFKISSNEPYIFLGVPPDFVFTSMA